MRNFIKACKLRGHNPVVVATDHVLNRVLGRNIIKTPKVKIRGIHNITTTDRLEIGLLNIGFTDKSDRTLINVRGKWKIQGKFSIASGCRFDIGENANVTFGSGYINAFTKIIIMDHLSIGDRCAISWDCQLLDTDFHEVHFEGVKTKERGIEIGDNVLIGNSVSISRGARIPNGAVVAANSLVNKVFTEPNTLIGGIPAKVIKRNINWD